MTDHLSVLEERLKATECQLAIEREKVTSLEALISSKEEEIRMLHHELQQLNHELLLVHTV